MSDNLTPKQRSLAMSRVKQKDTDLEKIVRAELRKLGYRFKTNVKSLPGKPDVVFPTAKLAVFVDGDFWHGYRFPQWQHKLKLFWKRKITKTRLRDQRNFRRLRSMGWQVIRIWQHQIKSNRDLCLRKIIVCLKSERGAINDRVPPYSKTRS